MPGEFRFPKTGYLPTTQSVIWKPTYAGAWRLALTNTSTGSSVKVNIYLDKGGLGSARNYGPRDYEMGPCESASYSFVIEEDDEVEAIATSASTVSYTIQGVQE
jgi:hypothetical protein